MFFGVLCARQNPFYLDHELGVSAKESVRLLGVVSVEGKRGALLQRLSKTKTVFVGDAYEEYRVAAISEQQVTLTHEDKTLVVVIGS